MKRLLSALACSGLLSACATDDLARQRALEEAMRTAERAAMAALPETALQAQELLPGECGLFLWSKTDTSKFIFFSKAITETATLTQGELPVALTQTGAGGDLFGEFNTRTTYRAENGSDVELELTPGEMLDGGQRVRDGLITVTNSAGWLTKLPVLGVRACQPK